MKYLFLVIAVACLALFLAAGYFAADLAPDTEATRSLGLPSGGGPSTWQIVQNVSAVAGIVSFLIQVVQWRRYRRS